MKTLATLLLATAAIAATHSEAQAKYPMALRRAQQYTWHGQNYHTQWGQPIALVVPPTANMNTEYGWGVTNTRIRRLDHQFYRDYPMAESGGPFSRTPYWPSDTTQFGVYPVRGPW